MEKIIDKFIFVGKFVKSLFFLCLVVVCFYSRYIHNFDMKHIISHTHTYLEIHMLFFIFWQNHNTFKSVIYFFLFRFLVFQDHILYWVWYWDLAMSWCEWEDIFSLFYMLIFFWNFGFDIQSIYILRHLLFIFKVCFWILENFPCFF